MEIAAVIVMDYNLALALVSIVLVIWGFCLFKVIKDNSLNNLQKILWFAFILTTPLGLIVYLVSAFIGFLKKRVTLAS